MDKNVENIIANIDFSMKMEDMPLTEDDKYRLRNCITGKTDINTVLQETIKKYTLVEVQLWKNILIKVPKIIVIPEPQY